MSTVRRVGDLAEKLEKDVERMFHGQFTSDEYRAAMGAVQAAWLSSIAASLERIADALEKKS